MATKNVTFDYSVDSASFSTSADFDKKDWDTADRDERVDMCREHALSEIDEFLSIDEESINDDE